MSDKLDDAIGYLSRIQPHWDVLLDEIEGRREAGFTDLKRGDQYTDAKVLGAMVALDDLYNFLKYYEASVSEPE